MKITEVELIDSSRSKSVPVIIYTPENDVDILPIVIFNTGYQAQENLGDTDGLEFIDKSNSHVEARKHLWFRKEKNILFVIMLF